MLSVGLHTYVYLVGLRRDVGIEQYLDLEMQLERKLGNHNSCVLSNDRHAASEGRIFHLHRLIAAQILNKFGRLLTERLRLKIEIKFY